MDKILYKSEKIHDTAHTCKCIIKRENRKRIPHDDQYLCMYIPWYDHSGPGYRHTIIGMLNHSSGSDIWINIDVHNILVYILVKEKNISRLESKADKIIYFYYVLK